MQIDWVTVAAQIVNFLILVWLLHWVLYRPLTRALKERQEAVERSLREAEAARATAEREAEAHRDAVRALEAARHTRLAAVEEEAAGLLAAMTEQAHGELAERHATWQAQLEHEKAAFLDRLRRRAGEAFVTLARRALEEMADEDLVDRIAHVFARRLAALDPEEQQHLKEAAGSDEALVLRSSFPLSPAAQTLIADAAGRVVERAVAIDFREDPGLECGVELAIGSRHVGWTLGAHLDALETDVARLLSGRADAKADA